MPGQVTAVPVGFRFRTEPTVRQIGDRLIGGRPLRVLQLSPAGLSAWAELRAGRVASPAAGRLARRLSDAGFGHPVPPPGPSPEVTVVVPVRDRPQALERCLAGLDHRYPVVVVDDASIEPAAVAAVAARHGARLLRRGRNGGPAAARNDGWAAVRTPLVAFLDSDCEPDGDWISRLAAHFADPMVAAVAPRVIVRPTGSTAGRHAAIRGALDLGTLPGRVGPGGRVAYVPSAALLVRRAALPTAPFDVDLRIGEDVDLVWRLDRAGWRVRYDPAVTVAHAPPSGWPELLKRRHSYGTSAAPLAVRHPGALAPLIGEPWSLTAIAALLLGRRRCAAAVLLAAVAAERRVRIDAGAGPAGAVGAVLTRAGLTLRSAGTYATQLLGPALVAALVAGSRPGATPPARRLATVVGALLIAPPVATGFSRRPPGNPARFVLAHVAEDIAYGSGVLHGCMRTRTARALRPVVARGPSLRGVGAQEGKPG